jgi:hypothetical protein
VNYEENKGQTVKDSFLMCKNEGNVSAEDFFRIFFWVVDAALVLVNGSFTCIWML